ncbi:MAG TPA: hypothetical protein VFQ38_12975 [Longimicrobiales bacterium]|nr:hypothetical protein [Longimicrobiales bacterium]
MRPNAGRLAVLLRRAVFAAPACLILAHAPPPLAAQGIDSTITRELHFRFIGPEGNRAVAVVGVPGDPLVAYVGGASGGVFKTTNGGHDWTPVFDDQPVLAMGALAVAPSDANVLYAGTGETFVRSGMNMGFGVWRSDDAGKTWRHVGLERTGRIGRIVVDPRDPDVAFVCALGHTYGPQPERGVFRTRDGGATWEKVLFVDAETGCSDLAMDPTNPRILFAGMWQVSVRTWMLKSGGPGSGVFVSRDGGTTWERIRGHGLPEKETGKTAVAVAASDPGRVYALMEDTDPTLYRSDDGGRSWSLVSRDHNLAERAPYYVRFAVDPADADHLFVASVRLSESTDGGKTLRAVGAGGDNHDVWIDPKNPARVMVGFDGGVMFSLDRGKTWAHPVLPIAQMYHVYTDDRVPYFVYGNRQDGYSYRGPSNSRRPGGIPLGLWSSVGGCESGFAIPEPKDPDVVWSGCYDGGLERFDLRTGQTRNVRVWPDAAYGWTPADVKYRWNWTFPIAISPHDAGTVYVGSQYVHRTTDGGHSWQTISPDLTTNDRTHQQSSGYLTPDNLMVNDGATLFAIAESPVEKGVIWAGSNDGLVHVTRDGGAHWENVTKAIPKLPPWGTVSNIEPSAYDAGAAYVAVDFHQVGDFDPYIFKTEDYGRSWRALGAGIPRSPMSYVHVVREDPVRKGMLYAGTDNGLYVSLDDGRSWASLQPGADGSGGAAPGVAGRRTAASGRDGRLPHAPVSWLTVQPRFGDLVVATYGRGFWILDDITPLRELDRARAAGGPYLFRPRDAWRFRPVATIYSGAEGLAAGSNPPYGADLNVYLPQATSKDTLRVLVLAPGGDTVRTLGQAARSGINRIWWDLRWEAPRKAKLRTAPPGRGWVPLGADGTRPLVTWDLDLVGGQLGPLAAPDTYRVRVLAQGKALEERLVVLKDPHSAGSAADARAQLAASLRLRADIDTVVAMIDRLEWMRKDLHDIPARLQRRPGTDTVVAAAAALAKQALEVEGLLYDVNLTGAREDAFRAPMRLYGKLSALASDVGASSADFPPTTQQLAVLSELEATMADARTRLDTLMRGDAAAFNRLLREHELDGVIVTEARP